MVYIVLAFTPWPKYQVHLIDGLMYFVHLLCIRNYDRCTRKMLEYSLPIEQQLIFHVMWFIVWPWCIAFEISILDQLTGTYILSHIVPWSALISQVSSLCCGNDVSSRYIRWKSVLDYATMIGQILRLFIDIVITSILFVGLYKWASQIFVFQWSIIIGACNITLENLHNISHSESFTNLTFQLIGEAVLINIE